eukprot:3843866-Prymnesium_polylepis.1
MASLTQQLFMMPGLRAGLLSAPLPADPERAEMMGELQSMLATLAYSRRAAFNPAAFCAAFRTFEGGRIEPHEQRDADEFLQVRCHMRTGAVILG